VFQGLFGWLRTSVKAAVLGGVQDAITELQLARLEEIEVPRLTLTTPAPEATEAEPASKRRKAGA